jgi:type I restriction enzyme S subunit
MGSNWRKESLTEHYDVRSGLSKPAKDFGSGFPFLSFKNVFYNYFTPTELTELVQSSDKERLGCSVKRGDVFLTRTSETMNELGMSCVALKDYEHATFNGFCKRLRPKKDTELVPEYVGYYLRSPQFRNEMLAFSTMSTRASLNNEMISRLEISFPEPKVQETIAHILRTLDNKIELNRQTNQTLEQMAQALFKSWFVDFDPVFDNLLASVDFNLDNLENRLPDELKQKAQRRLVALDSLENAVEVKASLIALAHELQAQLPTKEAIQAAVQILGKTAETPVKPNFNANPKILAQHANTHAHFPNEFEHNEQLGWIPKGWEVSALSELINIKHGFAYKGEFFSEEKTKDVLLTPGNVKVGGGFKGDKYKYYKGPIIEEYRFNKNDMYVNMTDLSKASDTLGYPAIVPEMDGVIFHHNQRLGKVLYTGAKSAKSGFIYQILCSNNSRNNILASATGTTVKHTSPTKILSLMICHSGGSIESLYEKNAKILSEKLAGNNSNNIELTKLRDTLLPKLISGELQIPNVTTDEEVVD